VISEGADSEEQEYAPSVWVSTRVGCASIRASVFYSRLTKAKMQGFRALFRYISGDNGARMKIAMTRPVVFRVAGGCSEVVASFFLGNDVSAEFPRPLERGVFVESMPSMRVFVRKFSSFVPLPSEDYVFNQAGLLRKVLKERGEEGVESDEFFDVQYNSPFDLFKEKHEVWVRRKTAI